MGSKIKSAIGQHFYLWCYSTDIIHYLTLIWFHKYFSFTLTSGAIWRQGQTQIFWDYHPSFCLYIIYLWFFLSKYLIQKNWKYIYTQQLDVMNGNAFWMLSVLMVSNSGVWAAFVSTDRTLWEQTAIETNPGSTHLADPAKPVAALQTHLFSN